MQKSRRLAPILHGTSGRAIAQIAECIDGLRNDDIFSLNAGDLLMAHDFTHCGRETIFRHFDQNGLIGPSRNDVEIATLIIRSVLIVDLVGSMLAEKRGSPDAATELALVASRRINDEDAY